MRTYAPSPITPDDDDTDQGVEASQTRDVTEPELAPPVRPTPVGSKINEKINSKIDSKISSKSNEKVPEKAPDRVRSRKETLVSPIPALLAASMKQIREDKGDSTPVPIAVRGEETSRFETSDQRALLMDDEADFESDYIVEVVDSHKTDY
jgi:hypothetical protein